MVGGVHERHTLWMVSVQNFSLSADALRTRITIHGDHTYIMQLEDEWVDKQWRNYGTPQADEQLGCSGF